jgi:hypothetical protein
VTEEETDPETKVSEKAPKISITEEVATAKETTDAPSKFPATPSNEAEVPVITNDLMTKSPRTSMATS